MDEWLKFTETKLSEKEEFYSNLNMDDCTDANYMHAKRVCKDFEIKHLGECHDLYLIHYHDIKIWFVSDTLLLAYFSENFRKMCLKIYHLNPVKFVSAPKLAWKLASRKDRSKITIIRIDVLLMVLTGIRGGICHTIHRYAKANNKYMKDNDKKRIIIP